MKKCNWISFPRLLLGAATSVDNAIKKKLMVLKQKHLLIINRSNIWCLLLMFIQILYGTIRQFMMCCYCWFRLVRMTAVRITSQRAVHESHSYFRKKFLVARWRISIKSSSIMNASKPNFQVKRALER